MNKLFNKPKEEREKNRGTQKIYRFKNGYGASVIMHPFSYGGKSGLWELAVIKFDSNDNFDFEINYDTEITDDVLGHLKEEEVEDALNKIKNLKQ